MKTQATNMFDGPARANLKASAPLDRVLPLPTMGCNDCVVRGRYIDKHVDSVFFSKLVRPPTSERQ
jgi:hypothetical protein